MQYRPFTLPTDADAFDEWLQQQVVLHAPDIEMALQPYGKDRRRYEFKHDGETVLELDVLPLNKSRIEIYAAALDEIGSNLYGVFYRRANESYDAKLPKLDWLRIAISISDAKGDPDKPMPDIWLEGLTPEEIERQYAERRERIEKARRRLPVIDNIMAEPRKTPSEPTGRPRNTLYDEAYNEMRLRKLTVQEAFIEIKSRYPQEAKSLDLNQFKAAMSYRRRSNSSRKRGRKR